MKRLLLSLLLAASAASIQAMDTADEVITRARGFLGGEAALNAVQSVHLSGHLEVIEDVEGKPQREGADIDLIYQKPMQHRMILKLGNRTESTGIDNFSGWILIEPNDPASKTQVTAIGLQALRSLRLSVGENLFFFRNPAVESVAVDGEVDVGGRATNKLTFNYERGVKFVRYFDRMTGELVQSETPQGARVAEEGRIEAGGVKFPRRTLSTLELPGGKVRKVEMILDKAEVNQTYPESDFAMPLPVRRP